MQIAGTSTPKLVENGTSENPQTARLRHLLHHPKMKVRRPGSRRASVAPAAPRPTRLGQLRCRNIPSPVRTRRAGKVFCAKIISPSTWRFVTFASASFATNPSPATNWSATSANISWSVVCATWDFTTRPGWTCTWASCTQTWPEIRSRWNLRMRCCDFFNY